MKPSTRPSLESVLEDEDCGLHCPSPPPDRHYSVSEQRRPLIDRVTNAWHSEKFPLASDLETDYADDSDDDSDYSDGEDECCTALGSRRLRRAMLRLLCLAGIAWAIWAWYRRPSDSDQYFAQGFDATDGRFGVQVPGKFKDLVMVRALDRALVPGAAETDAQGKRRLVFIGDIHGCKKELLHLLEKVGFDATRDHLVAAGDVISKGPDSAGVVDTLIDLKASVVRGNHEDRILLVADSRLRHQEGGDSKGEGVGEDESVDKHHGIPLSPAKPKDEELLSQLERHHLDFLRSLPVILTIPAISPPVAMAAPPLLPEPELEAEKHKEKKKKKKKQDTILHDIYVVHGGLVPAVPLLRQDPYAVMNMRSIEPSTHVPSAERRFGVPWERIWGWYQAQLANGKSAAFQQNDNNNSIIHDATDTSPRDDGAVSPQGWKRWWDRYLGRRSRKAQKPAVVVYGHDSKRGLNLQPWSKGLDSGCVGGGRLTALVLDAWGRQQVVSVVCKNYRKA